MLIFTFLCATSQIKILTLDGVLDFHINLAREKGIGFDILDNAIKDDLTRNKPE